QNKSVTTANGPINEALCKVLCHNLCVVFQLLYARLRRSIAKDIRWLNSLRPAIKITCLIFGIALIVFAWSRGWDWWTTPRIFLTSGMDREVSPIVEAGGDVRVLLMLLVAP